MTAEAFIHGFRVGLEKRATRSTFKSPLMHGASRSLVRVLKKILGSSSQSGVTPSNVALEIKKQELKKKRKKRKGGKR